LFVWRNCDCLAINLGIFYKSEMIEVCDERWTENGKKRVMCCCVFHIFLNFVVDFEFKSLLEDIFDEHTDTSSTSDHCSVSEL
jgi:hypothetical protein